MFVFISGDSIFSLHGHVLPVSDDKGSLLPTLSEQLALNLAIILHTNIQMIGKYCHFQMLWRVPYSSPLNYFRMNEIFINILIMNIWAYLAGIKC